MTTAQTTTPTKSEIFRVYNHARSAARNGKLDMGRVNRALGIAQQTQPRPYLTTTKSCSCPDAARGHICKHRIVAMFEYRISQAQPPAQVEVTIVGQRGWDKGCFSIVINGKHYYNPTPTSTLRVKAVAKKMGRRIGLANNWII